MPVHDICSKALVCTLGHTTLEEAALLMRDQHVGGVVIVDTMESLRPIGMITDRDIVLKIAEHRPLSTPVEDVMTTHVITAHSDDGIAKVVEKMRVENVRRVVILDRFDRACGVLSADDVLQLVAQEMNDLGRLVESQPWQEGAPKSTDDSVLMT